MSSGARTTWLTAAAVIMSTAVTTIVMQAQGQAEENRLVIETFELPPNRSIGDAIAEASTLVQKMRATGEYKSVRLYMHEWGPELAVYIVQEPKSWASVKAGWEKLVASTPTLMTETYREMSFRYGQLRV